MAEDAKARHSGQGGHRDAGGHHQHQDPEPESLGKIRASSTAPAPVTLTTSPVQVLLKPEESSLALTYGSISKPGITESGEIKKASCLVTGP